MYILLSDNMYVFTFRLYVNNSFSVSMQLWSVFIIHAEFSLTP